MEHTYKYIVVKTFGNKTSEFLKCLLIRRKVFIEEQCISEDIEVDTHDEHSYHYLLMINESNEKQIPVATGRWRITEKGIKLERFAVLKEYRNQGYGKHILDNILSDTIPFQKTIYLHSQDTAIHFYLKNGFEIEGEPFFEANIKHYKMVYKNQ